MRPFAMVEAKITLPRSLSIKSGRRDPMTKYFGFKIFLNRGKKIRSCPQIIELEF